MRCSVGLAVGLWTALTPVLARADSYTVLWQGLTETGRPPPGLSTRARSHLAIALRPLGLRLGSTAPFAAVVAAQCSFVDELARCTLEVVSPQAPARRAERSAAIPFRDADDVAESLALLVSDALQNDLHLSVVGEPPPVDEPPPEAPPVELAAPEPAPTVTVPDHRLLVGLGFDLAVDPAGLSPLLGGEVHARYLFGRFFHVGGVASLAGASTSASGFEVSFLRLFVGPQLGLALQGERWALEVGLGPGFFLLHADAKPSGGSHDLATAALAGGVRGAFFFTQGLGVEVGAQALASLKSARVSYDGEVLASSSPLSLVALVGIVYRR